MEKGQQMRIAHCPRCVNGCPLDAPKCITGKKLAEARGIYEPMPEEEEAEGFLRRLFKRK